MKRIIAILLMVALCLGMASCASARNERHDETKGDLLLLLPVGKMADEKFLSAQMDFASELFRKTAEAEDCKNVLISPLSVMIALAMTANGANGKTLSQMEDVLGGLAIGDLNQYLTEQIKNLPSGEDYKLHTANSIWAREGELVPKRSYAEGVKTFYDVEIHERPFNQTTVDEINAWVAENTDDMIKKVISGIDEAALLYLINAVCFDAAWHHPYAEIAVRKHDFTTLDGKIETVDMMHSRENFYISDKNTTGFIKDYADHKYQFVALLPNENIDFDDYVSSLTSKKIAGLLASAKAHPVNAGLPKFENEFEIKLPDILRDMGMIDAFDSNNADFSALSSTPVYINDILHKTFISVTEERTKAAAVTIVQAYGVSAPTDPSEPKEVILDRPFVYMIIDRETNSPIFMGTVTSIEN